MKKISEFAKRKHALKFSFSSVLEITCPKMQPSTNYSPTTSSSYSLPGLLWANMSARGHGTTGNPSPILLGWFIATNNIPFPPHSRSGLISVLSTLFWDLLTYQLSQERKNISVTKCRELPLGRPFPAFIFVPSLPSHGEQQGQACGWGGKAEVLRALTVTSQLTQPNRKDSKNEQKLSGSQASSKCCSA